MPSKWPSIQTRLPPPLWEKLQARAARNGRSEYAEAAHILADALAPDMVGLLNSPAARYPKPKPVEKPVKAVGKPAQKRQPTNQSSPRNGVRYHYSVDKDGEIHDHTIPPPAPTTFPKAAQRPERRLASAKAPNACTHPIIRRIGSLCALCGEKVGGKKA